MRKITVIPIAHRLFVINLLLGFPMLIMAQSGGTGKPRITAMAEWFGTGLAFEQGHRTHPDRVQVTPLIEHPLKDPSVCRGPDGWYYLTGTDGTPILPEYGEVDFLNNDGIRLWRSKDLENWEPMGKVFDLSLEGQGEMHRMDGYQGWQLKPGNHLGAGGEWTRGVQAPEIHYLKDNFWIVYSLNGEAGGLLRSSTGKPEGPYEEHALMGEARAPWGNKGASLLFTEGGSPSLFEDDDGSVYLVWGEGKIARMKDDMTGLAETPRPLFSQNRAREGKLITDFPIHVGRDGYFLTKLKGRYFLFATDVASRGGERVTDVYVAWADNVYGPYSERRWSIPHSGQTTVFEGPDGKLWATYCGADADATFTDRAGIVPLEWSTSDLWHGVPPETAFPRRLLAVNTERHLWHRIPPIADVPVRDTFACLGPDGAIYYTGSFVTPHNQGRLFLFRSTDMVNWEPIEIWDWDRQKALFDEPFADPRDKKTGQIFSYMDTEVWYLNDTFYVGYSIYGAKPNGHILRSTTGKAEGPYEPVYSGGIAQPSFFQDEDGTIYMTTNAAYRPWKDDLSGPVEDVRNKPIRAADGSLYAGDAAGQMVRMHGKYVYFNCGVDNATYHGKVSASTPGAYTWSYQTADSIEGPWSRERVIGPHSGHGGVVQDRFGNWWVCSFANEASHGQPGLNFQTAYIHPLEVTVEDGELRIDMADEFPDYVEKALREREARGD